MIWPRFWAKSVMKGDLPPVCKFLTELTVRKVGNVRGENCVWAIFLEERMFLNFGFHLNF